MEETLGSDRKDYRDSSRPRRKHGVDGSALGMEECEPRTHWRRVGGRRSVRSPCGKAGEGRIQTITVLCIMTKRPGF